MSEIKPITQEAIAKSSGFPTLVAELSPTQMGWLALEAKKRGTFSDLEKQELAVQGLLNGIEKIEDLDFVQRKMKEAKGIASTAKDQRLQFTNLITAKLIEPSMAFEKRNESLIKTAQDHELTLRTAAANAAEEQNAIKKEEASLKAHIENEHFRVAAGYKLQLADRITESYITAINGKIPPAEIPAYLEKVKAFLAEEKPPAPMKFERKLVSKEKALEIYNSIPVFHPKNALAQAINDLQEKFKMYEQELQNSELAAATAIKENEEKKAATQAKLELETATNVLIAQAEVGNIETPKIKRNLVVVFENTQTWAMAVLSHFIKNFNLVLPKLKVKTWGNLKIEQMAAALGALATETGEEYAGLTLKEEIK